MNVLSWYSKSFDFMEFNLTLLDGLQKEERIIVFDPSYLPKSGKQTAGLGYFWSGCTKGNRDRRICFC